MIKKYLGVLAVVVALCGIMTVSASAAGNYLYNGVELPVLPSIDGCDYMVLFETANPAVVGQDLYLYELRCFSCEPYKNDSGVIQCDFDSKYAFSSLILTNDESLKETLEAQGEVVGLWETVEYSSVASGTTGIDGEIWTNFDYKDAGGNIVLAASEPVPVGSEAPPTEGSGFDTLEGLTVFFSSSALDYEKGCCWWRVENLNPDLEYHGQLRLFVEGVTEYLMLENFTITSTDVWSDIWFFDGLASETTYRAHLTIWQDYEYYKVVESTFTTDAQPSVGGSTTDPDDSGTTTDPDQSETEEDNSLEEWDKVTEVPDSVKDKTEQGDKIKEELDSLDKPDPEEIVPDIEVDAGIIRQLFGGVLNDSFIVSILTMSVGFALAGYALFGKRG